MSSQQVELGDRYFARWDNRGKANEEMTIFRPENGTIILQKNSLDFLQKILHDAHQKEVDLNTPR